MVPGRGRNFLSLAIVTASERGISVTSTTKQRALGLALAAILALPFLSCPIFPRRLAGPCKAANADLHPSLSEPGKGSTLEDSPRVAAPDAARDVGHWLGLAVV